MIIYLLMPTSYWNGGGRPVNEMRLINIMLGIHGSGTAAHMIGPGGVLVRVAPGQDLSRAIVVGDDKGFDEVRPAPLTAL